MTLAQISAVRLGGSPRLPLLVLGPSLGTSARELWSAAAIHLSEHFEVLAWDLPGHGSSPAVDEPLTPAELAAGVLELVDEMFANRGELHTSFFYAGDGLGGVVGLHLLLDSPGRIGSAVLLHAGDPADVRARLAEVSAPVLLVAGGLDAEPSREIAAAVPVGQLVVLDDVVGSAPLEAPAEVARLIVAHAAGDEAIEALPAELSREIQELVSEHDDETILARPGLDPRSRSIAAVTTAAIQGRLDDLGVLVVAARSNGLTDTEVRELLLQTALHSGITEVAAALNLAEKSPG